MAAPFTSRKRTCDDGMLQPSEVKGSDLIIPPLEWKEDCILSPLDMKEFMFLPAEMVPAKKSKLLPLSAPSRSIGGSSETGVACQSDEHSLGGGGSAGVPCLVARHHLPATVTGSSSKSKIAEANPAPTVVSPASSSVSTVCTSVSTSTADLWTESTDNKRDEEETTEATVTSQPGGSASSKDTTTTSTSAASESRGSIYKRRMAHYRRRDKPPYSYLGMIIVAIQYSPYQALSLAEVCSKLRDMFPFFTGKYQGWRDSIRHNLSGNRCFQKVPPSEDKGPVLRRRTNRWRVDWTHVASDVFLLQRGRPGCEDPKWKPTLQQYLGLPDVNLPPQSAHCDSGREAASRLKPSPTDCVFAPVPSLPAQHHLRPVPEVRLPESGLAFHTPYDFPRVLPTSTPFWMWGHSREVGVDLSTKHQPQAPDNADLLVRSPTSDDLATLPRATSTPDPKGNMADALRCLYNLNGSKQPGSPAVEFPSIDNEGCQQLLPQPLAQQTSAFTEDYQQFRNRQRQISGCSGIWGVNSDRSRHSSDRPLSSSSDMGYFTSEDSVNQSSGRFGVHRAQSAASMYQHPGSFLPSLSGPYYSSSSAFSPWQPPVFHPPPSGCEALGVQQMPSAGAMQPFQMFPPFPAQEAECLYPPSMQYGEGLANQMIPHFPSPPPPFPYGAQSIQGCLGQYPFQQLQYSQYPPYPPPPYPGPHMSQGTSVPISQQPPQLQVCRKDEESPCSGNFQTTPASSNSNSDKQSHQQNVHQTAETVVTSGHTSDQFVTCTTAEATDQRTCKRPETVNLRLRPAESEGTSTSSSRRASAELSAVLPKSSLVTFSPTTDDCSGDDFVSVTNCSTGFSHGYPTQMRL